MLYNDGLFIKIFIVISKSLHKERLFQDSASRWQESVQAMCLINIIRDNMLSLKIKESCKFKVLKSAMQTIFVAVFILKLNTNKEGAKRAVAVG